MWKLICKWATRTHPNKPKHWVTARYLAKFSWTRIVRHQMVKGTSSVDAPALAGYWRERRRKHKQSAPVYAREPSGLV